MDVGKYLKEEIKKQGYNMSNFAEELPFTRQRLEEVLKHKDKITFYSVKCIVDALDLTVVVKLLDKNNKEIKEHAYTKEIKELNSDCSYYRLKKYADLIGARVVFKIKEK